MGYQILCNHVLTALAEMAAESVDMCVTSPPYWSQRKYQGEQDTIWGGQKDCQHAWGALWPEHHPGQVEQTKWKNADAAGHGQTAKSGQFCSLCGAWRGAYGLEPTPEMYIAHSMEILRAIRRVLKPWAMVWWNISDQQSFDLQLIPESLVVALRNDGWYVRSIVIWHKCLEGTQPIYARSREKPLRTTVKEISRLPMDTLELPSADGQWLKVLSVADQGVQETLTLHLRNGYRCQVTADHRFPMADGLMLASDLRVGDVLSNVLLPDEQGTPLGTYDLGWMVGLYVAEGNLNKHGLALSLNAKETDFACKIEEHAERWGGSACRYTKEHSLRVTLNGAVAVASILNFVAGNGAKGKHLARTAWAESNHFLEGVLDGYLAGDGSFEQHTRRWRLGFTRNFELAEDLRTIAARLGYSLRLTSARATGFGKTWAIMRGNLRKQKTTHWNSKSDHDIVLINRTKGRVYEISIASPHVFALSDGTLTHNSAPMPESVHGWYFEGHKVKIGNTGRGKENWRANATSTPQQDHDKDGNFKSDSVWLDCPGCPKCAPNDGLVLRKGSWRPTDAYEQILMLAKSHEYYGDGEAVRENAGTIYTRKGHGKPLCGVLGEGRNDRQRFAEDITTNGRNLRNVWTMSSAQFKGQHYSVYPLELPRKCILASTSERGNCSSCGRPWARVIDKQSAPDSVMTATRNPNDGFIKGTRSGGVFHGSGQKLQDWIDEHPTQTIGWRPTCSCNAPAQPATVLDPFMGTGTTLIVAEELGRNSIGIDISPEYCAMTVHRIMDAENKRALDQEKAERRVQRQAKRKIVVVDRGNGHDDDLVSALRTTVLGVDIGTELAEDMDADMEEFELAESGAQG